MRTFKAAALMAPLFLMLAACNDGLSSAQMDSTEGLMTAAQEEEAFNTLPSEEEKIAIMEESQAQHALEADLLGAQGSTNCKGAYGAPDPVKKGLVTLTFDDGPGPKTGALLNILAKYNVKATFFVLGQNAAKNQKMLQRMVDEGHIVASHSYSHPNFWKLGESGARKQIAATDEILAPFMNTGKFFRYPYGNSTCTSRAILKEYGYQEPLGWHVDTLDWKNRTSGLASSAFRQIQAAGGGIVLFHDIHANSVAAIEPLIIRLKDAGYRFTNVDDASAYPKLNRGNNLAQRLSGLQ